MPEVLSFPLTIGPGDSLPLPIRFAPVSFGAKTADDHDKQQRSGRRRLRINVSGDAPSG